jgi:hypothetical protein
MSAIVSMLEGETVITVPPTSNTDKSTSEDLRFKAFQTLSQDSQVTGVSTDAPWSNTSASLTSSKEESITDTSRLMD